jgi:D-tyrosyl-tRNA(Tyr) deacylase
VRAVLQRVRRAWVEVGDERIAEIGPGLLILLGIRKGDGIAQAARLAQKCARLRIFEDDRGRLNRSLIDTKGEALVVSQFTLYGDLARGLRPSFDLVGEPGMAEERYLHFCEELRGQGIMVKTGQFGAQMLVGLENLGPVTFILEV